MEKGNYHTPETPHFHVQSSEENKIGQEEHKLYQSGVGMLLYLVKHSCLDIANAVCEVSKVLNATGK